MNMKKYVEWIIRVLYIFFFKQKTAYEMRISDWSSDVCSSDLEQQGCRAAVGDLDLVVVTHRHLDVATEGLAQALDEGGIVERGLDLGGGNDAHQTFRTGQEPAGLVLAGIALGAPAASAGGGTAPRSEEHTYELQSLMRN